MRKNVIGILVLIFSAQSYAKTNVGDYANFEGSAAYECGTKVDSYTSQKKIVSKSYSNGDIGVVLHTLTRFSSGDIKNIEQEFPENQLIDGRSLITAYQVKKYCGQFSNAQVEQISTPAGQFLTCHISLETSDGQKNQYWIGGVALGVVKLSIESNELNIPNCLNKYDGQITESHFED